MEGQHNLEQLIVEEEAEALVHLLVLVEKEL
jgi:hypothetical protein